eukprot:COSAG01_NODE_7505_length_3177_cov_3.303345_2_plen_120_part_00
MGGGMGGHAGCQPGVEAGRKASLPLPLPPARRGAPPALLSLLLLLAPGGRSLRPRCSLHVRWYREGDARGRAVAPAATTAHQSTVQPPSPVVCTQKGVRCYGEGDWGAAPQKPTVRSPE